MKPVTTLLAIAVVAGIFVLGGFAFLDGMQPQGPLVGSLGQKNTTLTLTIGPCMADDRTGTVIYALSGTLLDSSGSPVANRTVGISKGMMDVNGHLMQSPPSEWVVTKSDGSFSLEKKEFPTPNYDAGAYGEYKASFAGDEQYAASSSSPVRKLC